MAQLGVIWADGIWNTAIWNTAIWAQDAAPDVTAPTVSSIACDASSVVITFAEAIQAGGSFIEDAANGFTITPTNGGAAVLLSCAAAGISGSDLTLTASRTIVSTETFTAAFSGAANVIEDLAGNDLAAFSGTAVTNNSATNTTPTDISASGSTISVAAADGAVLCVLTATDPDPGETFTWALAVGTGDTNNADVAIDANTGVVTVDSAATLGVGSYTCRAQVTDSASNTRAEAVAFSVVAASTRAIIMTPVQSPIGDIVVTPVVG